MPDNRDGRSSGGGIFRGNRERDAADFGFCSTDIYGIHDSLHKIREFQNKSSADGMESVFADSYGIPVCPRNAVGSNAVLIMNISRKKTKRR